MKFYKRFLSLILTFILIFSISVPCYASDTNSDDSNPAGWDSWTFDEKYDFVMKQGINLISGFTGLVHGDQSFFREIVLDFYAARPESGVTNFYEYLVNGLSFDDSTETWTLSDDLVSFLNDFITNYNDQVTMVYRYPTPVQCISAENFPNNTVYQALIKTCMAYPNCYVLTSTSYYDPIQGGVYLALDGSVNSAYLGYCCWWYVIPEPFAGVSQYLDLATSSTTFYNDNWEDFFVPRKFIFTLDGRCFYQVNEELGGYASHFVEFEIDNFPLLEDADKGMDWAQFGTSYTTFLDNAYSASLFFSTDNFFTHFLKTFALGSEIE